MRQVTQEDIARKIGVTRITVSKALRNHPDISSAMKEKVHQAAEELGYTPNEIARQLTSRTTRTIGVIVPDLENSFFSHVVNSIIDTANNSGYQVLLTVSRENEEIEKKNLANLIGKRVDGLLVCLSQHTSDDIVFRRVKRMQIPLVFFDRTFSDSGYTSVVFDDTVGVQMALTRLIAEGYSCIAHFAGYRNSSIGRERLNGYLSTLMKNKIKITEGWIIEGGFELIDGYRSAKKLLQMGKLPELILTANDRVALGAYRALRERGLRIPEDIGIVGFGFSEIAEMFNPTLSVIAQDPRKMGSMAANRLINEIRMLPVETESEIRIHTDFLWNNSVMLKSKK